MPRRARSRSWSISSSALAKKGYQAALDAVVAFYGSPTESAEFLEAAKKVADQPALREGLWLVKNGVPFDVAFSLDDTERFAWSVCMGEF